MSEDSTHPSAKAMSITLGLPDEDVQIETKGHAMLNPSGEDVANVVIQLAEPDAGVQIVLSADDAAQLRDAIHTAIQDARNEKTKFENDR